MEKHFSSSEKTELPPSGNFDDEGDHAEKEPFTYKILKGHYQPDGKTWKSDERLQADYLQYTDGLIKTMTTPMDVMNHETGETEQQLPSVVVFLDKSARPLSHLVRNAWPTFAKDTETGELPPMPQFKFLNIDREQWVHKLDSEGSGILDANHLDESVIRSLRSVFMPPHNKDYIREHGLSKETDEMPTILDNKAVLIVDETRSTGRTAQIARGILRRAFPKATVDATHWMSESFTNNGRSFNSVPVWYKSDSKWGRGVNDRYADFTNPDSLDRTLPENYYRTMGRWFLSAPHWFAYPGRGPEQVRDNDYVQLIREIKELSRNPSVPVIPASSRYTTDEAFTDRIIAYNYDIDASSLTSEEKEALAQEVIDRKRAIDSESAKRNLG